MPVAMFRMFFLLWSLCLPLALWAQNTNIPLNSYNDRLLQRYEILDTVVDFHTFQKPYGRKEATQLAKSMSGPGIQPFNNRRDIYNILYLVNDHSEFFNGVQSGANKPVLGVFFQEAAHLFHAEGEHFFVHADPVIYNTFGSSSNNTSTLFENTRGFEIRAGIDQRVGFYVFATDNQATYPEYITESINANVQKVVPGLGWAKPFKESGYDFPMARGHMDLQLFNHLNLQIGQDRIFMGDGIRSLIWSDNAREPFYVRLQTAFWKVKYQSNFMELVNMNQPRLPDERWRKKYAALHDINIQVTPDLQMGLFESVIFQRNDSLGYPTGFELYYLNPIIFYRSVEYGLGSPDNVLLGLHWKWNLFHRFSFYGQFVLDELQFFNLTGNTGWWGNKWGLQSGLKYINAFGLNNLDLQYEWNSVRPYMYSYNNDNGSSYTHYAQALAHPLGANFAEHIISIDYQPLPKWWLSGKAVFASFGSDSLGSNWGQNIFLDYETREQDYDNVLLQGVDNTYLYQEWILSWQFWHNTFIDGRLIYRQLDNEVTGNNSELFFSLGVRMNNVIPQFRF